MISEDTLFHEIITRKETALVLVNSRWNAAGVIALSGFAELKEEFGDRMRFNRLVMEETVRLKETLNLGYSPSYLFFKEGQLAEVLRGLQPADELKAHISQFLGQS